MPTLVDTNVLLDLFTNDPVWSDWSVAALSAASAGGLMIKRHRLRGAVGPFPER